MERGLERWGRSATRVLRRHPYSVGLVFRASVIRTSYRHGMRSHTPSGSDSDPAAGSGGGSSKEFGGIRSTPSDWSGAGPQGDREPSRWAQWEVDRDGEVYDGEGQGEEG